MSEKVKSVSQINEAKSKNFISQTRRADLAQSQGTAIDQILILQRTIGNQAVKSLFKSGVIQAKLKISQPNDKYEREADRLADAVMQMPEHKVQRQSEAQEKMLRIQEESTQMPAVAPGLETHIQSIKGHGQPLPRSVRAFFEPRLGHYFTKVRVYNGDLGAKAASALNARAFTVGHNIVFGAGHYAPETSEGKKLLAHELTHTIQQSAFGASSSSIRHAFTIMRTPEQIGLDPVTERLSLYGSKIPRPTVVRVGDSILATIHFGQNDFLLDLLGFRLVERLSEELRLIPNPTVVVDGHASTEGSSEYNLDLSEKRRLAVIAVLRSKLSGAVTFGGKAYGESEPAVEETGKTSVDLENQRAQNRRVVVWIIPTPVVKPAKPIDLTLPIRPPTPEEELERILKEPPPPPIPKRSLSEMAREKFDDAVEDILRKAGIPRNYREPIKKAARDLVEKGLEKALDAALDQTGLSDKGKKAIKKAIRAASEIK